MDSSGFGRALDGLVWLAWIGGITAFIGFIMGPPLIAFGVAWLLEPRTGVAASDAWIYAQLGWPGLILVLVAIGKVHSGIVSRKDRERHKEFMELRDRFYRRDEVCCETLEQLRNRASDNQADKSKEQT